jgi:hypothetical protein
LIRKLVLAASLVCSILVVPEAAEAASACGNSGGHTLCVTAPAATLVGSTTITVTNTPNSGTVIATWVPSGKPATNLITRGQPSPQTGDYSFVWPTQKYLDGSGVLRIQFGSTSAASVQVSVTLQNGNTGDFQHSPADWANYLPGAWMASNDPVLPAVGDGPSDEPEPNSVAAAIAATSPPLFLFLGDIYEKGTFTENLNVYGQNSMDGGGGSLWGTIGTVTQPTIGNHEAPNQTAWTDYWHNRPLYTSFRFGNVLFFDLASSATSMAAGSAQYNYVQSVLASTANPPPPCIVAFWHIPALHKDTINAGELAIWTLLADNGVDLVLNGHVHNMTQYRPLNDQLQLPTGGQATMVQLISGAGGHGLGGASSASRVEWTMGKKAGVLWLTLNGARNGGTPSSLSWAFKDRTGTVLHTGARDCGSGPVPPAPPSVTGFSPTSGPLGISVTIDGSGFSGASDVQFNGTSVGPGNFTVNSDSQITATVPSGATTGPISVVGPGGTGTSSTDYMVTVPPISRVGQIGSVSNISGGALDTLSVTVGPGGVAAGDTITVGVAAQGNVSIRSVTDTAGNSYQTDVLRQYSGGSNKCTSALASAFASTALAGGDRITVTVSSGNTWGFVAEEWSGLSATQPDQTGGADSADVPTTVVSVSTVGPTNQAVEVVYGLSCLGGWSGITAGSGYTLTADLKMSLGTTKRELGLEYMLTSSAGPQTATFSLSTARNWSAAIVTYR